MADKVLIAQYVVPPYCASTFDYGLGNAYNTYSTPMTVTLELAREYDPLGLEGVRDYVPEGWNPYD